MRHYPKEASTLKKIRNNPTQASGIGADDREPPWAQHADGETVLQPRLPDIELGDLEVNGNGHANGRNGNGNGAHGALALSPPTSHIIAMIDEAERGAARIAELSEDLVEHVSEVAHCKLELILACRNAELLRLRSEVAETPAKVERRIALLRSKLAAV